MTFKIREEKPEKCEQWAVTRKETGQWALHARHPVPAQERTFGGLVRKEGATWCKNSGVKPAEHLPLPWGDLNVSWWGSSDLIQKRTLVPWSRTGRWAERESGFAWEGRRRWTQWYSPPSWILLEKPRERWGWEKGRGGVGLRKGNKAVWRSTPGAHWWEIEPARLCTVRGSGSECCVKGLGVQDDHSWGPRKPRQSWSTWDHTLCDHHVGATEPTRSSLANGTLLCPTALHPECVSWCNYVRC